MRTYAIGGLLLSAGWSSLCAAQGAPAPGPDDLGPEDAGKRIIVTATGLSSATSTTKTDTPIIEAPQSVSIVAREEMDLRGATTIADALSYTAGVQAEPMGIDSRTDEVSVRGFSAGGYSSNNNFVDGLRLPTGGQFTRFGFDTFGLQQIEVLKGPSGVLYGQSAPGGIVNIVTKRPTSRFQGEVLLQAQGYTDLGNWSGRLGADFGGPLDEDGRLSARLVGLAQHGGSQVNDVENSRYYVSPSVTWEPTSATSWTLLGQYQHDDGGATYQFLPALGTYEPSNGGYIANDANIGEPSWNNFTRNQYLAASFFRHEIADNLTFRNNLRYTHITSAYRVTVLSGGTVTDCSAVPQYGPACIDGQTIGRRAIASAGSSDGFAIDNQLEWRVRTGALAHTLLAGLDYFHTDWTHDRDLVSLPGLPRGQVDPLYDIFDPQPRGSRDYAANMAPQVYGAATSEQTGLYAQDEVEWGRLRLNIGGRYDWTSDHTRNRLTDTENDYDASKFTWRAGAVYLFDNGLAPYFSYSQSFIPQLVPLESVLDQQPFRPTTGEQFEAGLRYQAGTGIYLTAGVFEITQQNVQTNDPDGTICGNGNVCLVQAGEARIRGAELEARASLVSGTTVIASATHLDSDVTQDTHEDLVGKSLPQVPAYMASLFVNQRIANGPLAGLGFGGGVRYTGKSWGDAMNADFRIQDYTLFDLMLRYDLGEANAALEGIGLSLNARNVADTRYVVTCTSVASCYYGQGRVVTARVQFTW
ncbi:MAG: TonB-dependent siderophore receptor [Pseudomonadota bacterium]|nr:TonB-dependent siderophore receptor [Pseudomonadota bacterium]